MTPGFAPLSISWGWLLVGAVAGSFITLMTLFAAGLLRREPTVSSLALMATPGASVSQADQARNDVLAFIASEGRPALRQMAAANRLTEVEFLATVLGGNAQRAGSNSLAPAVPYRGII